MYDPDSSIKERILFLKYYEAFAPTDNKRNKKLDKIFNEIKQKREQDNMDAPEYCDLMENIIDAILYTRNIWEGRGERDLTYSYIYTLQHHLPIKAIFVLYMIVEKGIGSWRDVREYVEYINDPSCPFVKPILGLYNNQLEKDVIAYEMGLRDRENQKLHWSKISLAAKWVPREKKGRKYMFEALVQMWCYKNAEMKHIMDTASGQYSKDLAFNKCKKIYRTMISNLHSVISKGFVSETATLDNKDLVVTKKTPLWRIVKSVALKKNVEQMNQVWVAKFKSTLPKDYYVPLLDISEPMYEKGGKPLYKAIIKACQYAYASHFGPNILVFSHKPEWVNIEDCTLEQIVNRVQSVLFIPYVGLKEAFEMVQSAATAANMNEYDMSLLKVKLITCQPDYEPEVCQFMFEKVYF